MSVRYIKRMLLWKSQLIVRVQNTGQMANRQGQMAEGDAERMQSEYVAMALSLESSVAMMTERTEETTMACVGTWTESWFSLNTDRERRYRDVLLEMEREMRKFAVSGATATEIRLLRSQDQVTFGGL